MSKDQHVVKVSLSVTWGDHGRDAINQAIGVECDRYHAAGDPMGDSQLSYPANEWILAAPPVPAGLCEDCVEDFIDRIRPLAPRIAALDNGDIGFSITITGEARTGISLSPEVIAVLAQLGATVDMDSIITR